MDREPDARHDEHHQRRERVDADADPHRQRALASPPDRRERHSNPLEDRLVDDPVLPHHGQQELHDGHEEARRDREDGEGRGEPASTSDRRDAADDRRGDEGREEDVPSPPGVAADGGDVRGDFASAVLAREEGAPGQGEAEEAGERRHAWAPPEDEEA